MAIFTDESPVREAPRRGSTWFGWVLIAIAMLSIAAIALVPSPYVIEQPGPVYNVLGSVDAGKGEVPLIDIPGEKTYESAGSLDMLTVSIVGNREKRVNWFDTALAWLDPSKAVVPIESIYPEGETVEQSNAETEAQMTSSQQDAIAAALTELDYPVKTLITAGQVAKGSPAASVLKAGDVITRVNDVAVTDEASLRDAVVANGVDKALSMDIVRGTAKQTVSMTPVLSDADKPVPVIGIVIGNAFTFPVTVTIQLKDVGGPSAGQMFALGIIDKLTPGSLSGGADVAGTGTITEDGTVGPIGGIRQKMFGAVRAGADYFLAPESNCNEVTGHVPEGLTVFAVSTLDQSMTALKALAAKADTSALPTCPAS